MFLNIDRLELLLSRMLKVAKKVEATQSLKADDVYLEEGATLNIVMNNVIFNVDAVAECIEIVDDIKKYLPRKNGPNLDQAITNYRNTLIEKALENAGGSNRRAAERLGISYRQMRYRAAILKEDGE